MAEADLELNQTERPRFYEQQYLGADDLTAIVDYGRIARARHDLGGHVWGIAAGLELVEKPASVGVDVYVQPGYAWDGVGRPLIVLAPYKIPAELFKSIAYDAATDNTSTPGRTVSVWLQYVETPVGGPANGFQTCTTDDQYSRTVESFQIVIGDMPAHSDRHDPIDIAGNLADAARALQSLGSTSDPLVNDESIPYQTFPDAWGDAKWLIPLGVVRWLPNSDPTQAGSFQTRTSDDLTTSERQRVYAGVVAETVNAARGFIRMRSRDADYAPKVWSDDLVWCEGDLRVSGDTKLLAGQLMLRDQNNDDKGTPLTIGRTEVNSMTPSGRDMFVQIGSAQAGSNRFVVGPVITSGSTSTAQEILVVRDNGTVGIGSSSPASPLTIRGQGATEELMAFEAADGTQVWHVDQKLNGQSGLNIAESGVADGRLYIQAGGNVGVNNTSPTNQLHVSGNTGVRQNRLYLSGGDGNDNWSSITYNAYHNSTNGGWTFPDNTRKAVTIEMDDQGGTPRFQVYSTTTGATTSWTERLSLNGDTGDMAMAHNGGNVGVGTSSATHKLHVASNKGLRQNYLYVSGGDGTNARWSSLSYNAHHTDANDNWTFPDNTHPAVTIEMDDYGGNPRFEVFSTTLANKTNWVQRLALNGDTGAVAMAHNGGNVSVGLTGGICRLHVADAKSGNAGDVTSHVALIDNTATDSNADVLAIRIGDSLATSSNNFITFFAGANGIGAIEGNGFGGITVNTSGADYAEWMPRLSAKEQFEVGDVVGVFGGKISRKTEGADCVLAISTAPVILGNRPASSEADSYEKVAMLGQVPVKVRGKVSVGDFVVGTNEDGTGTAIHPDAMTFEDYARVLGVAWEANTTSGVKSVRVGIGLPTSAVWRALQREVMALRRASPHGKASARTADSEEEASKGHRNGASKRADKTAR